MPTQPGVWGIDLGQCALKAIRLEMIDGQLTATAFDYVEHPKILSQPDADPDQLTREALEKFLSRNTLRGDVVAISVPGQSGLARFVKLPPVEEKKITDIVRFEAKQQIPFNLDEVVWDYQKIGSGAVTDGFAMETEIGLFAMKRDMVNRYLGHFKDVGVEVHVVQMAPLALCNFVAYDLLNKGAGEGGADTNEKRCVVALDIGADSSNLVITDGERIIWQRPIPLGGNHFTRALTKDLKLTFAKAEHLKRNATKSPDLKKILAALKPVLNDFVGEVQRSLGYFTNTHRDAHVEYMVGLGNAFRLPGLQRFLGEKLQMDVRKLAKLERLGGDAVVTAPAYTENILSFAVAYGLAIQGIKLGRLSTNLLPSEIRTERLVRAKKPWAVAAAAALLLGTGAMALSYYLEERTYASPVVKKAMDDSGPIADQANRSNTAFTEAKKKAEEEAKAVKSIVAGTDERANWLDLTKFILSAVPQPDPDHSNIKDLPKRWNKYFVGTKKYATGTQAFNEYKKYQVAGKAAARGGPDAKDRPADELGPGIDDLVRFNIEAVDARYCDDLAAYWKNVQKHLQDKGREKDFVRPMEQFQTPPTGKGWVVEVQGYTFHHLEHTFVLETLMESLAKKGDVKVQPASNPGPGGTPTTPTPPPAAPPASGTGADGKKPEEATQDPVKGKISHIVLYETRRKPTSDTNGFELIGQSHVSEAIKGEAAAAGPGGPGAPGGGTQAMPMSPPGGKGGMGAAGMTPQLGGGGMAGGGGQTTPTRDSWVAQGTLPDAAGGAGGAGGAGAGRGMMGGVAMPRPGGMVPPGVDRGTGERETKGSSKSGHVRTEFVIFFIWQEPTPSDALRGVTESTGDSSGGTPTTPAAPTMPQR